MNKAEHSLETFWAGEFGDKYTERNVGLVDNNEVFFKRVLYTQSAWNGRSIVEFGAGSGQNLAALRQYLPRSQLTGVEINKTAIAKMQQIYGVNVVEASVLDEAVTLKADLVITKGLLIHIAPSDIKAAYRQLYHTCISHILIAEYYSPQVVEVEYRGLAGKLWKRDFAGEMLDLFPSLRLVDYGFAYHLDPYPQDDLTWFMLEKTSK